MHGNVQVSVRRGGVGVPEQSGPGLLPDLFRQENTDRPLPLPSGAMIPAKSVRAATPAQISFFRQALPFSDARCL